MWPMGVWSKWGSGQSTLTRIQGNTSGRILAPTRAYGMMNSLSGSTAINLCFTCRYCAHDVGGLIQVLLPCHRVHGGAPLKGVPSRPLGRLFFCACMRTLADLFCLAQYTSYNVIKLCDIVHKIGVTRQVSTPAVQCWVWYGHCSTLQCRILKGYTQVASSNTSTVYNTVP